MSLDIDTERGQESLKQEYKMLKYVSECWEVKIKTTKKDKPVPYDGVIIVDDKIVGIFESKNRQETLEQFEKWGTWLITLEKLEKCRKIAHKMNVPFYGILGIERSQLVMYWKISDSDGNYLFEFDHWVGPTQKTTNGGIIERDNAYLPMKFAKFVQPNKKFER